MERVTKERKEETDYDVPPEQQALPCEKVGTSLPISRVDRLRPVSGSSLP